MIVVDIEVPGLFPEEHGICQIGAIDLIDMKADIKNLQKGDKNAKRK